MWPKADNTPDEALPEAIEAPAATRTAPLTPEQRLQAWRLLKLIDALGTREPIDLDDIDLLGQIANSRADLHDVCKALRSGCSLGNAVVIFT